MAINAILHTAIALVFLLPLILFVCLFVFFDPVGFWQELVFWIIAVKLFAGQIVATICYISFLNEVYK